ncbi:MAG: hypothetical protein HW416_3637 [Chloroflexi bacterium]|nr:hypothetical protein [Chloroflexota bacterium]
MNSRQQLIGRRLRLGLAVVAIGLLPASALASPDSQSSPCVPSAEDACLLAAGQVGMAVLGDPEGAHLWSIDRSMSLRSGIFAWS